MYNAPKLPPIISATISVHVSRVYPGLVSAVIPAFNSNNSHVIPTKRTPLKQAINRLKLLRFVREKDISIYVIHENTIPPKR